MIRTIKRRASLIECLESRRLLAGPAAPVVTSIPSPNFNSRSGTTIDSIVIHTTESSYQSTINTFLSTSSGVSAHYVNNTDGTITQMVDNFNRAWHATYYNSRSIGIENVGYAGQASTWNPQNLSSLEHLVAYLAYTYKVPVVHPTGNAYDYPNDQLNEKGIVAHGQVQPWNRTDPGPYFPWTQFITDVQKIISDSTAPPASPTPYLGAPVNIGTSTATIQAENFDLGGEGVAYHDVEAANKGGKYRTTEGVDIETTTDTGGGYNVGYVKGGEWLDYTVKVASKGLYNVSFRVASNGVGGTFHLALDGTTNLTGSLAVPNTGGWMNFTTVTKSGVQLPAGTHILQLVMDTPGPTANIGNFNYIAVAPQNLALNRPTVSSSNETTNFSAKNATDGSSTTRWSSLHTDPQWIYVDLGATRNINRVVLNWETAYAKSYQIQVSNDASNWTTIYSTTNSAGGKQNLPGLSGSGRYVRMLGTQRGTQWGYSLWDFEVYGSL